MTQPTHPMRGSWEKMLSWVLKRHFEAICRLKYFKSSLLIQKLLTTTPPPLLRHWKEKYRCVNLINNNSNLQSRQLRKSWKDITILDMVFWHSSCSKFLPKRWRANHLLKLTEIVYISWHNKYKCQVYCWNWSNKLFWNSGHS